MNYKVRIKQCRSPSRAAVIAEEIARRSGAAPEEILWALSEKAICIKQGANRQEAMHLKEEFEAAGAEVEFEAEETHALTSAENDDELEDVPGRILTEDEFMERMKLRTDIFAIEREGRLRRIEAACLVAGIASGMWLTKQEMATVVRPDYIEKIPKEFTVKVVDPSTLSGVPKPKTPEPPKRVAEVSDIKTPKKSGSAGYHGRRGGGGDPRERVTQMGLLGLISGKVTGKSVASADIFGKGGFASNIDAIIQGTSGLKTGGDGGVGRKGVAGIGYGIGINSGMGGDGDMGIDDIMGSLMPSVSDLKLVNPNFKHARLAVNPPAIIPGNGVLTGGRSRASIMRVVMQNLSALRYAYNKRLREKQGLQGKITCKFAIDEFGKVIFCQMIESSISDPLLETEVVAKIRGWVFEKIDKPGDVTDVVYPFAFSQ